MPESGPDRAHLWLARAAGEWELHGEYYFGPNQDPVEAVGREKVEMFGQYWRRGHLEVDLLGSDVSGCTSLGFDPLRQVFVSTWYDSSNPFLYAYEGRYDEEQGVLAMSGLNTDPGTGKTSTYRSVEVLVDDDSRTLDLYVEVPGLPEAKILHYAFTRTK